MNLFLLLLALSGHVFLWVALVNRLHAVAIPHRVIRVLTAICFACLALVPVGFGWWFVSAGIAVLGGLHRRQIPAAAVFYLGACWAAAAVTIFWWVWRVATRRSPAVLRWHRTRSLETDDDLRSVDSAGCAHHFLVHLPGNEILQLEVTQRAIDVARLAPALDGLSIVHLSDFHFTGRVGKAYFQQIVRHSNRMEPDLVAITGDVVDKPEYIDWVPDTLGRLRSRFGVCFVLGNHDLRVDTDRLRRTLADSGLVDLGGRWIQLEIRGEPVVLAGNELPWIAPAADMTNCPQRSGDGGPLRIVLSHSPDQLDWARAQDADLLLAGHTHGGQIRLPLIGAIFAPSADGVKYASGVFYTPPTVLHVTRGVSGQLPVRLNCPPEMAHLVLRAVKRG